jgi:hypothetical protein
VLCFEPAGGQLLLSGGFSLDVSKDGFFTG